MKGIILAGGHGTRLMPATKVTNKHLLPVYNKPMIYYPIEKLTQAGIKEIMIVSGPGHAGHFLNLLGSGKDFNAKFSFEVQEEAGGIAQALGLCEDFADEQKVAVILGDNIFYDDIIGAVEKFRNQEKGAKIFLKEVNDASRFGVAEINGDKIVGIEEKPQQPKSNLAVVGIYMYDKQVWNVIKTLKPSGRGELEVTDVNNFYVKQGTMQFEVLKGWWTDAGTLPSLMRASKLVAQEVMTDEEKELAGVE
ncbi:MAG: sugar phosphate nucleotidyltransferase [Patescibacteria group bacterium]|nr:sugar phosphate nucleotidyltransferase [Patescibacteria group bacterium]